MSCSLPRSSSSPVSYLLPPSLPPLHSFLLPYSRFLTLPPPFLSFSVLTPPPPLSFYLILLLLLSPHSPSSLRFIVTPTSLCVCSRWWWMWQSLMPPGKQVVIRAAPCVSSFAAHKYPALFSIITCIIAPRPSSVHPTIVGGAIQSYQYASVPGSPPYNCPVLASPVSQLHV